MENKINIPEDAGKIITIAGTRPEIIKLSGLIPILNNKYDHELLYTGQHYSTNMKDIFFDELNLQPKYDLESNTSEIRILKDNILKLLRTIKPAYVIVYGDTNSSMAGSQAAKEIGSTLIHIEAGVRDFDIAVPEEVIRLQIDSISDYLFCPSEFCMTVLKYENIPGKTYLTGNLIVDVCKRLSELPAEKFIDVDIEGEYILLTLHRPENCDDFQRLKMLKKHLESLRYKVIFPVHPRTMKNLNKYGINLPSNVQCIEPASYLTFLHLLRNCKIVLTDSGGVQEESIVLKKPCITLRHTSARWETILLKANILFPLDRTEPLSEYVEMMQSRNITFNPYGENVELLTTKTIEQIISNVN